MSLIDLFASQSNIFGGRQRSFEESKYVVFGVPFDATSTYRTGARFGPNAIRLASLNIETFSFRSNQDLEEAMICDIGDLDISADPRKTCDIIKQVTEEIFLAGKIPVAIGGEHTITYGIIKGLGEKTKNTAIVSFDAHLDLRTEFMGLKLSHTTFMQLINKEAQPPKIIEVGTRSVCQDELKYAKKAGIEFIPTQQIKQEGTKKIIELLKEKLAPYENIYLTIDMDILDPAFAPAVQNPEADGISTGNLIDLTCGICDRRILGFDTLEIAPNYDQGISAIAAAKSMFEILCQLQNNFSK
ncbi:MAG: agmatinase [Crenarchaeota archaeon]|nr:agmatinase [Thermoproteota archaeon]